MRQLGARGQELGTRNFRAMGKIGRKRKYSHGKYKNRQVPSSSSSTFPLAYQFCLRDVPLSVLNQPSINNYSSPKFPRTTFSTASGT